MSPEGELVSLSTIRTDRRMMFREIIAAYFENLTKSASFTYLACLINVNNDSSAEIKNIILLANKGFYGAWGSVVV